MKRKKQDCNYCNPKYTTENGSGWPMLEYYYDVVSIFDNDLQLRYLIDEKGIYVSKDIIHIRYCPMCGRKLR